LISASLPKMLNEELPLGCVNDDTGVMAAVRVGRSGRVKQVPTNLLNPVNNTKDRPFVLFDEGQGEGLKVTKPLHIQAESRGRPLLKWDSCPVPYATRTALRLAFNRTKYPTKFCR
jgi:hypothetical protein